MAYHLTLQQGIVGVTLGIPLGLVLVTGVALVAGPGAAAGFPGWLAFLIGLVIPGTYAFLTGAF